MNQVLIVIIVALTLLSDTAFGQRALSSADGSSGVIGTYEQGNLNYEASTSRIGINYQTGDPIQLDPVTKRIANHGDIQFDVGASANKGRKDLFAGGDFVPGVDGSATGSYTWEHDGAGYHLVFARVGASTAQRKLAGVSTGDMLDTVSKRSTAATEALATLGFNWSPDENLVLGLSGTGGYTWNSTRHLKERSVCTTVGQDNSNTSGPIVVADCDDRLIGNARDEGIGQLRVDLTWNILSLGDEKAATLGLLGALSTTLSTRNNTTFNIAFGPTLHPSGRPSEVAIALLVEAIDVGNQLGTRPDLDDQLRLRVYVGVPFSVFGIGS